MEDWVTWDTFDRQMPYGEGTEKQDVEWLDAIKAVETAYKKAQHDYEAEEAARQAQEAKRKK